MEEKELVQIQELKIKFGIEDKEKEIEKAG